MAVLVPLLLSSTVECQSACLNAFSEIRCCYDLEKAAEFVVPIRILRESGTELFKILKTRVPGRQGRMGYLCMQCQEFGNNREMVYCLTCYRAPHLTCALADMWGCRTRSRCSTNRLTNTTRSRPGTRSAPLQALHSKSPHSTRTTLTTAGKRSSWTCHYQLVNARMMVKSSVLSVRYGLFNLRSY